MYIKYRSLFLIFLLAVSTLFSQSAKKRIDSLMQVAGSSNDSIRLRLYNSKLVLYFECISAGKTTFTEGDKAIQK